MKRLTDTQKSEIKHFIKQGKSLGHISRKFGIGKTTIYYYMRKINGRKIKPVVFDTSDEQKIGEFIGVFAGDGSYFFDKISNNYRIRIHFNKDETDVISHYKKVIENLFGKSPNLIDEKYCIALELRSKDVINFIKSYLEWDGNKTYTVKLAKRVGSLPKEFLTGFVRGLIDSDGYVRHGRKEIYFGTTSAGLHNNFIKSLRVLGFDFKCYKQITKSNHTFHKTRLANDEVTKFIGLIKPVKGSMPPP